jgi:hypothetical protein
MLMNFGKKHNQLKIMLKLLKNSGQVEVNDKALEKHLG